MKHKLTNMLSLFAAGDKEGAAKSLSEYIKQKSANLIESDRQYRKGSWGEESQEPFEDRVETSYAGLPITIHFKGTQNVEVAHSRDTRYEPGDSEIVEYLEIADVDITLINGTEEEYVCFDDDFQQYKNIEYIKEQLAYIESDTLFGKPLVIDELAKVILAAVLLVAKNNENKSP